MCGIVGYVGKTPAVPILIQGLEKLEYRGYESSGVACLFQNRLQIIKSEGKLESLKTMIKGQNPQGHIGIGHTRWATHGKPSVQNAHPHTNPRQTIAVVHNGIIENHAKLKSELEALGYRFSSETDSETIVHLIDYYYQKEKEPLQAIRQALLQLEGSYALAILFADCESTLFAARKDSPLVIGLGKGETFLASDTHALLQHTKKVICLHDFEMAVLQPNGVKLYDLALEPITRTPATVAWDSASAHKEGFAHFMLKEIHEQPTAIRNTLAAYLKNGDIGFDTNILSPPKLKTLRKIHIVACGSAYHAGIVGKYVIESLARLSVEVDLASEFRYRNPILEKDSLCIAISQSGETADTLAALREAKRQKTPTVAIVNVVGSSIAREADTTLCTHAGIEIAVATTKAYSTQLVVLYLLALFLANLRQTITQEELNAYLEELTRLPDKIKELLNRQEIIRNFAKKAANEKDVFFIGRGIDYAATLEASLKLKEISYIHSEAYAAGELKHGTISLIEKGTLVISLATQPKLYEKILSNTNEVLCRGASVFAVTHQSHKALWQKADWSLLLPKITPLFSASLSAIPLQLFAYYVSLAKGLDVDKPRNLAKSVTVE